MHHGKISVKDNHPCGSIFLITFPLHQNSEVIEEDDTIKMQSAEEESRQSTILLVDDNYDFLKFLSESLSKQYHILKASNGKQALSILKKEDADLIISDVMMPEMDGLELCSNIKKDIRYSHIPMPCNWRFVSCLLILKRLLFGKDADSFRETALSFVSDKGG